MYERRRTRWFDLCRENRRTVTAEAAFTCLPAAAVVASALNVDNVLLGTLIRWMWLAGGCLTEVLPAKRWGSCVLAFLAFVLIISRKVEGVEGGLQSATAASDHSSNKGVSDETVRYVLHKAWRENANDFDGLLPANRRNVPVNGKPVSRDAWHRGSGRNQSSALPAVLMRVLVQA